MSNNSNKTAADSFLNEFQLEGKAANDGKIALEDWEDSMDGVNKIVTPETREAYKNIDWETVPRHNMAIYCHDCRAIFPPNLRLLVAVPVKFVASVDLKKSQKDVKML